MIIMWNKVSWSICLLLGTFVPTLVNAADKTAAQSHEFASINALVAIFVVAFSVLISYLIKKFKFYYLPESAATMLIGMAIGGVARAVTNNESELQALRFEPELFFFLLLPPIIFEAGYTLKRKRFFRNFSTIIMYAVIGTIISTFVIGGLIFAFAKAGVVPLDDTSPLQSLMFGALISAVDPVATLSIMGHPEMNCDPLLYSLVFGESVLNDAVSIVLFKTLQGLVERGTALDNAGSYILIVFEFIGIALGSIVVGVVIGLTACVICKHTNLRKYPSKEITLLFVFAYAAYAVGEAIELSGVMSLFFCGIVLGHYNWYNLSEISRESSHYTFKAFSHTTETVVYMYMGMVVFTGEYDNWSAAFVALGVFACLLARACNTFPLSLLANIKRKIRIPLKMQFVIWFAGLRGAIAFALSLNMPAISDWEDSNQYVVTTTLCIVIFTTVVCGGMTEPMLSSFNMKTGSADSEDEGEQFDYQMIEAAATGSKPPETSPVRRSKLHRFWKYVDKRYMKRWFGGKPETSDESISLITGNRNLSTYTQNAEDVHTTQHHLLADTSNHDQDHYVEPNVELEVDTDGDIGAGRGEYFGTLSADVTSSRPEKFT